MTWRFRPDPTAGLSAPDGVGGVLLGREGWMVTVWGVGCLDLTKG